MAETVVLVVDADEETRLETANFVREGIDAVSVLTANSIATGLDTLKNQSIDVVVTGFNLPDGNGLELADQVREVSPGTGCILYTRTADIATESFEDVVVEFVEKEAPDVAETLVALIEQAGPEQTQAAHPVPDTERERLQAAEAMEGTFDPDITKPLERIAQLALDHYAATGSAITLILREEQKPVATVGPAMAPQFREDSITTHTLVHEDECMAVEDTRTDPRFSEIEAIQGADIVSYLGAPISDNKSHAIAVLSVYDQEPRTFSAADRKFMEELATLASDILALDGDGE